MGSSILCAQSSPSAIDFVTTSVELLQLQRSMVILIWSFLLSLLYLVIRFQKVVERTGSQESAALRGLAANRLKQQRWGLSRPQSIVVPTRKIVEPIEHLSVSESSSS